MDFRLGDFFKSKPQPDRGVAGEPEPRFQSQHARATLVGSTLCVTVIPESVSDREATILFNETDALLDARATHLVVDLTHVQVLTSAGIGALVRLHKRQEERGYRMAVCALNEQLDELFRITRMDRLFALAADLPGAIGAFRS